MQERVCEKLWLLCNKNTLACVVIFYFAIPGGQLFEEVMPKSATRRIPCLLYARAEPEDTLVPNGFGKVSQGMDLLTTFYGRRESLPTYLKATIPEEVRMYIYLFAAPLVSDTSTEQRMQTSEEVDSKICCVN